jgi:membrane-bound lytic murein transglycosylase B
MKIPKIIFISILFLAFCFTSFSVFAQDLAVEERQALEEELKQLEEKIAQYDADITKTQQEKNTLQSQISLLKKQIEKLNLQIQQNNVMIKDLGFQIKDTESSIDQTSLKVKESREQLASVLQTIYEEDQKSPIEVLLTENEISDFFNNLMYLENLNSKNKDLLDDIKDLKLELEGQKESLDEEKGSLENLVKIQGLQKQESESSRKTQEATLKLTEAQYQKSLQEKKATEQMVAEIKSRIFELIGVPEAPNFGEALAIAKSVESITGVRSALLLAVLTQESNVGKNVGQCYLKNTTTGAGLTFKGTAINNVMKPSRDVQPFLTITQELGRDPFNTLVSCPIASVGGYGGAMGPAQFIPSTWMSYRDKLKEINGRAADPWNIKDAFLAAALYLQKFGADSQTYNAEWKAAMIYFSGTTNTKYRFYGDSVMALATNYAKDIKEIEGQ